MEKIIKEQVFKKSFDYSWPEKFLEQVNCPLCRSDKFAKLYPHYYSRIVRCKNCNLIYTNPRLKKNYLKNLYSEEYFNNENSGVLGYEHYVKDEENIKKTFERRLKKIEKIIKPGKVLDIGCATGFFMQTAINKGWEAEGIEISEYAASIGKKNKLKIYNEDLSKIKLGKKKYDLITLWDLIEHVTDPVKTLKKVHSILKKGGIIAMTTPDVGSIPAKITRHKWVGYKLSDEHLTYFSRKTIFQLLEKSGFTPISFNHTGKYVNFYLFADRVGLYNKPVGNLLKILGKVLFRNTKFYISAFDIMCVYAKKS